MGNAYRFAKSSTTILSLTESEELTSLHISPLEQRVDHDNNGSSDRNGHLHHLTNDGSDLPSDCEGQDASGHAREVTTKDPDHHVTLWTVGFLIFTVLDCVLLGLLVKVSVELTALPTPSANASAARSSEVLLEDSAFCLPCSEVYLNEIEMLQNRFRVRQRRASGARRVWNDSLCCAEPHDDLKTLVGEMFIRVHYGRDRASGEVKIDVNETEDDSSDDVITPHLQLQLNKDVEPPEVNGTHTLPLMLSKRDVSRRAGKKTTTSSSSASVREGVIKISHPGHFYIYSYVPFSFSLQPTTLTQYLYRVRNGGETLLLENSVFPCDVSQQSCEQSFVGGVFLFESGDGVVLRVSNHSHVRRKEEVELGVHRL